jgi:hypothetical protein
MRDARGPDTRSGPDPRRDHCEPQLDGEYQPGSDGLASEPNSDPSVQPEPHAGPDPAQANRRLA